MHVYIICTTYPDSKVHGANMGPTWVLSAPDGPHVGPMNLATRVVASDSQISCHTYCFGFFPAELHTELLEPN